MFGPGPKDEQAAAFFDAFSRFFESLDKKLIVSKIPARITRMKSEEYNYRLPQKIPGMDCDIERRIIQPSLSALHPVNNDTALKVGLPSAANGNARIAAKLLKASN